MCAALLIFKMDLPEDRSLVNKDQEPTLLACAVVVLLGYTSITSVHGFGKDIRA